MRNPQRSLQRLLFVAPLCVILLGLNAEWCEGQQVSELTARHSSGQTILTWKEVNPPFTSDTITFTEFKAVTGYPYWNLVDTPNKIRYRIYRSTSPITDLSGLQPIATTGPLTCWNFSYANGTALDSDTINRYIVETGQPRVAAGTGIYAHNPAAGGTAYYAVTYSSNDVESITISSGVNSLASPVTETTGEGPFILQQVVSDVSFDFVDHCTLNYYVRWESGSNSAAPSRPIDYLVGVPPNVKSPAAMGVFLHCWGGTLNGGYAWIDNAGAKGDIFIAANQDPYDWWTGYHEKLYNGPLCIPPFFKNSGQDYNSWTNGVVRPYTQTRMMSFMKWAEANYNVDSSRTHLAGVSMGGSGTGMFAIRYPEKFAFARAWVGVHNPAGTPTFSNSYAEVYGQQGWGIKFENGIPVWDYYNDSWYLRRYPTNDVPFMTFSNGKNDGAIGWPQAVDYYQALRDTKRPFIFCWGQNGHGQRTTYPGGAQDTMPIDMQINQTVPAFTFCSLDNNPGNGDTSDGDAEGQINAYMFWETTNLVDSVSRWEMTVSLISASPSSSCTVDLTPRRCQQFHPQYGQSFTWTNVDVASGNPIQSGAANADTNGLVTIPQVTVSKTQNRIIIVRAALATPIISNIASADTTTNSETITWTTDIPSDSQVEYGYTAGYGSLTALDPAQVTSHGVTVTVVTAGTTYHYRVKSTPTAGNTAVSTDRTFTSDGLPDSWQIQHFGSTANPDAAPTVDPDGDGMNNLDEYVAGTLPTNKVSKLSVTELVLDDTGATFKFRSVLGRRYSGSYSSSLLPGDWDYLTNNVPGTGGQIEILDTNRPALRFYKVGVSLE